MIRFIICSIFIFIQISIYSQRNRIGISQIETIDSVLIGKKIKKALKILDIDSNWRIIHEPPMIAHGIRINEVEGYSVQLITDRIPINKFRKKTRKMDYSRILKYRIIGVSWESESKCKSIGDIIPHYAYDKYGPCEKE